MSKSLSITTSHIELAQSLPIFSKLEVDDLKNLLKDAHLNHYKKDSLLFLEGEKAINFYIILKGKVKLFKNSSDGQELILKIAKKGQNICTSTAITNSHFPVSGMAIENVEILSIPLKIVKQQLKNIPEFSDNLTSDIANESRELMHRLGELNLRSAEERVCWFLLNLSLENIDHNNRVQLPCNKLLIASYLGMKPETFSRVMQNLKEKGYLKTEKNFVIFVNRFALCEFCDFEIAYKCSRHNSKDCPNPQCLDTIS